VNAAAPGTSRRRFLTRLFSETNTDTTATELSPMEDLRKHGDGVLWAAAADAADNMYIAGDDGVLLHFNGETWSPEKFPGKHPTHSLCIANNTVYSVGWLGLICQRIDGIWHRMQGGESDTGTENLPLFEVAADSSGKIWAVGDQGRVTAFDGSKWKEYNSGTTANLRAVLPLEDGRVLVAGTGGTALLFENGACSSIATNTGCTIVSMAQLGSDSVIAVGGEYDLEAGAFRGRLFLYSDNLWQPIETEIPLPRLRRVRRCGEQLLICGDGGTAFRWTAEGARRLPARLRYDLHDIICLEDAKLLICGDSGCVLQERTAQPGEKSAPNIEKQRWHTISQGETVRTLRTAWHIGKEQLIAAGDSGTVLHIDGEQIVERTTPQQLRIHGLWGSSPKNIFAVCDSSTILHFDGETWTIAHQGNVDTALLAITGFGPHDIFAVGDSGYALRYDGLMWRHIETGVQQELYGLWGQDSQHLLAVGGGGLVMRWNGERWKSFSAGTDHDLYGVSGSGLARLFLIGLSGTLIRFEDNAWHRDFSGVRSDLHTVAASEGVFYATGSNGTILRNRDGIWEPENSGCDATLQAMAFTDSSIYAVGSGGVVLRSSKGGT
jgi:photosystem II stability/assembly factor-like uncharacterized protein